MKRLLAEYIRNILTEESKPIEKGEGIPPEAVGKYRGKFGNVYADPQLTQYLGKIQQGRWIPAAQAPEKKQPTQGMQSQPTGKQPVVAKPDRVPVSTEPVKRGQLVSKELYGDDNSGPLLQGKESDTQKSLDLGYVKGASHVAPGNAGSNFNENFSNEGVLILEKYPDLSEEELAEVIFERTKNSQLASQLNRISPVRKIKFPSGLTTQEKDIYSACVIAARSAMSKRERSVKELSGISEELFSSNRVNKVFGGTSEDLKNLRKEVESANIVYVYDEDLGLVEIPKENILEWVDISGGGENAADTAVLTIDANGNVLYQGWSDKTSLSDLQGNSSLNKEFSNIRDGVNALRRSGQINKETARNSFNAISKFIKTVSSIEDSYSDITRTNAEYFLGLEDERVSSFAEAADKDRTTTKHYNKFREKIDKILAGESKGVSLSVRSAIEEAYPRRSDESREDYYKRLTDQAAKQGGSFYFYLLNKMAQEGATNKDENKIIVRLAAAERKIIKQSGQDLPDSLDTRKALSRMRQTALDSQRELYQTLDTLPAEARSGKSKTLGELVGVRDAIEFYHLDKLDSPKNRSDHRQALRRNTQLVMEGIPITPNDMRDCMRVSSTRELEDQFKLSFEERYTYKDPPKNTIVSGKVLIIYALDSEGGQIEIGQKVYRTKDSETGKTQTTIEWSKDMQECFSTKGRD